MALPTITVNFKTQAETAVSRSAQGILCIVVKETTASVKQCAVLSDVGASYTTTNKAAISRAFIETSPNKVVIVAGTFASADALKAVLDEQEFGWICTTESTYQAYLTSYVTGYNSGSHSHKVKALVTGVTASNDHIAVMANQTLTVSGETGNVSSAAYITRIAAMLCACPITESITYKALPEVSSVTTVSLSGDRTEYNTIYLFRDDGSIRISKGYMSNSTSTAEVKTAIVEAKDILVEDIVLNFKNNYLGRRRNSPANQALFVADIIGYLNDLAAQGVLNAENTLYAEVDVAAMRAQWTSAGVDVSSLTDAQVKNKPYHAYVFVAVTCSILDAMEDMVVNITLE